MDYIPLNIPADFTAEYEGHIVTAAELAANPNGAAAAAYLLVYGWKQSLQDSVASIATRVKDAKPDARKVMVRDHNMTDDVTDEDLAKAVRAMTLAARAKAIMAGAVGVRVGGARLDPIESRMRDIADAKIYAAAKKKGAKRPTGDDLSELRAGYIAKHGDALRQLAESQLAMEAELND